MAFSAFSQVEARGNDCIRISLAAEKLLQHLSRCDMCRGRPRYTVNGSWRPCFSELHLHEDGWVHFPELGKKAQLPFDQAGSGKFFDFHHCSIFFIHLVHLLRFLTPREVYTLRSRLLALQKRSQDCEKMEELGWEPGPALWLVVDAGSATSPKTLAATGPPRFSLRLATRQRTPLEQRPPPVWQQKDLRGTLRG